MTCRIVHFACSMTLLVLFGCGAPAVDLVEVEGTITINNKAAGNLLIQFSPETATQAKTVTASAVSDASGRFVLKCENGKPGTTPGAHKVTVADNNLSTEGEFEPGAKRPPANRVPPAYLSASTTPLSVVVQKDKKTYDLNISASK